MWKACRIVNKHIIYICNYLTYIPITLINDQII